MESIEFKKIDTMSVWRTNEEWNNFNNFFSNNNVLVDAKAKEVHYNEHWSSLSIKCAFNGSENYHGNNFFYKVNDSNYLIFNEGKLSSSFIDSNSEVSSLTLHFSKHFEQAALTAIIESDDCLLDDPLFSSKEKFRFAEKLYNHDNYITPIILKLKELSADIPPNTALINDTYYCLLERMVQNQKVVNKEIFRMEPLRISNKKELYKRLTIAKDFMNSCYHQNITLADIATLCCLNQFYFLRQFKKAFEITPHQYLTAIRLKEASRLIMTTDKSISEICTDLSFSDLASFSKLFKRNFNYSPIAFKKQFTQ